MSSPAVYDIFVSHNRRQKPWVRQVVAFLRAKGLRVFFDEDSIEPGEDIIAALEGAIESSGALVLVLSRSSVFSKWVAFETAIRLYEDPGGGLHRLIPVLVEPVDRTLIRPAVRRLDAVDLTDPCTRETEFRHFLRTIGITDVATAQLPPWPEPGPVEELHIADLSNVTEWNWSGKQLLETLISIDYEILSELTNEQEGHAAQWVPVFLDHPDTWRLLVTPLNQIVGYWHFVPLFDDDFRCAMNGTLKDGEITTDKVRLFELPGVYPLYIVSFGLLPRYRRTKGYCLLLNSLFDVIRELAKDGIFFDKVCANAFSSSGDSLCKSFGMRYLNPHLDHGKVYTTTMQEVLELDACQRYGELRVLYGDRFGLPGNEQKVRSAVTKSS